MLSMRNIADYQMGQVPYSFIVSRIMDKLRVPTDFGAFSVTPTMKPFPGAASRSNFRVMSFISYGSEMCTEEGKLMDMALPCHASRASASGRSPSGGGVKASITSR